MRCIDALFFRATAAFRARGAVLTVDLYYTPFDFGLIISIEGMHHGDWFVCNGRV